jgi:hypothetical protein
MLRKSALSKPSSPLWGGVGGGGVSECLWGSGANTPTLALPTRGREKEAWFPAMDSLLRDFVPTLRCAPAGPVRRTGRMTLSL